MLKIVIAPIVAAAVFLPTVTTALWAVLHGRGAAEYFNVYGLPISYTSLLIMVATVTFALGVAYAARLIYFWRYDRGEVASIREIQSQTPYTDPGDSK
jgi:hypothetical protein